MVQKAEKFCAENEFNKAKIEAKNGLGSIVSFAWGMSKTLNEEKLKRDSKVETGRRPRLQCRIPLGAILFSRAATTRSLSQARFEVLCTDYFLQTVIREVFNGEEPNRPINLDGPVSTCSG